MNWILVFLIGAFPVLSHAAAMLDAPLLQWLAIVLLLVAALLKGLVAGRPRAWLALALIGGGLLEVALLGGGMFMLYLPSIAIPALLAWVFGSTLRAGHTPLVTHIADAARRLTPELRVYCRSLTRMWTVVFLVMVVGMTLLAASGHKLWWSFFANFANYALTGAVFLGEYLYRIHRFPDYDHPGFIEYLRIIIRAGIRPAAKA